MTPEQFIERWEASGAAERANYQLFLTELCALLEVPQPEPSRAVCRSSHKPRCLSRA